MNYIEEELALGQPVSPCFKRKVKTTLRRKKKRKYLKYVWATALPCLISLCCIKGIQIGWVFYTERSGQRFTRKHAATMPSSCPSQPGVGKRQGDKAGGSVTGWELPEGSSSFSKPWNSECSGYFLLIHIPCISVSAIYVTSKRLPHLKERGTLSVIPEGGRSFQPLTYLLLI